MNEHEHDETGNCYDCERKWRERTSCEYAVEAHGATICGSCWWCRGE